MSEADVTDITAISIELGMAKDRLQELVSTTSIDLFGTSTRAFMDKAVLTSAIGVIVSTFGALDKDATLGPFKITINATWVVPAAVLFAVLFYGVGLALLAQMDFRRWTAIYALKSASLTSLAQQIQTLGVRDLQEFEVFSNQIESRVVAGEFLDDSTLTDGIPMELKVRADELRKRSETMAQLISQIGNPLIRMRRQAKGQIAAFVLLPLAFSFLAFTLCVWSALKAYMTMK